MSVKDIIFAANSSVASPQPYNFTLRDSASNIGATPVNIPTTVVAGDLIVYSQYNVSNVVDYATPAGWTYVLDFNTGAAAGTMAIVIKVSDGTEGGTSLSLFSGINASSVIILDSDFPVSIQSIPYVYGESSTGALTPTFPVSSYSAPLLVIAATGTNGNISNDFLTPSSTFFEGIGGSESIRMGIVDVDLNETPINISANTTDQGRQTLIGAVIALNVAIGSPAPPSPSSQIEYTTPGTYSWVCPSGVTSVSVVCVGAGGNGASTASNPGGEGGGLGYKNNIPVTPGVSYTVNVGAPVSTSTPEVSYFISAATVSGVGGAGGQNANVGSRTTGCGTYVGDGGGLGGFSESIGTYGHGGCGAGGYSGNGGNAVNNSNGTAGAGGGGGAGGDGGGSSSSAGGGGGGVGLLGQGANGAGGTYSAGTGGEGGSGGSNGVDRTGSIAGNGGNYGGGGGQSADTGGAGGFGAVRIIWPGDLRQFPSTRTLDE